MGKFQDLTGYRFGRLKVVKRGEDWISKKGTPFVRWECECDCGKQGILVRAGDLKNGRQVSCGCYQKEIAASYGKLNKKQNVYDLTGEYGIGYTSKGEEFYFDLEDYDKIKDYCWCIYNGYVVDRNMTAMHNIIMPLDDGLVPDHIHGRNTRNDNRKSNLRPVTRQQNSMNHELSTKNTSGVTGVSWDKSVNKWVAYIGINMKTIFLGYHTNKEDAIQARKDAEKKYFREYAYDYSQHINDEKGA